MSLKEELSKAVGAFANKVGDVSKKAGAQAQVMTEIAKLNLKITQEQDKIRKAETELGKLYYNDFEAGLPIEAETYLPLCNEIKAAKETIEQHRAAIEELKKRPEAEAEAEVQAEVEVEAGTEEAVESCTGCCDEKASVAEEIEFTVVDDVPAAPAEDPENPEA